MNEAKQISPSTSPITKTKSLELAEASPTKREFNIIYKREKANKSNKEKIFSVSLVK
jgi:hypothetical protein